MKDDKIRLATTDPALKGKININLVGDFDSIYWYIRFNTPLNERTVSANNMNVTDTDGYIMRTDIRYDNDKNMIEISPLDSYMENVFYILNISRRVKSAKGQPLKKEIHILFKLYNRQISEYELLKSTVKPPEPVPRPKDYDNIMAKKYSFANIEEKISRDYLEFKDININILLCLAGLILTVASVYFNIMALLAVSVLISIAGVIHVFIQMKNTNFNGSMVYNIGVMQFNKGKYEKARRNFERAFKHNPDDEDAEYALSKVKFYL
ncbi:MAG: hypothetical protein LBU94_03030 [Clostridiales bacterium]|jgi:tetratricopeptide (TPR) repeat protein|nr:hypothetical protein [Clostridiales bacterium]